MLLVAATHSARPVFSQRTTRSHRALITSLAAASSMFTLAKISCLHSATIIPWSQGLSPPASLRESRHLAIPFTTAGVPLGTAPLHASIPSHFPPASLTLASAWHHVAWAAATAD